MSFSVKMDARTYVFLVCISNYVFTIAKETELLDTPSGKIEGLKHSYKDTEETIYEFRGIPYAKPPTGNLRFRKPEPLEDRWDGVKDATSYGAACPQNILDSTAARPKTSEDCLFLNVYAPRSLTASGNRSVMVWIHGGGFEVGYGSDEEFSFSEMVMEGDIVLVTLNYRLGALGFFALDHAAARGNYGLWDQKLALQWVHNNIEAFGGNPGSVTLFGQSTGGYSVSLQSLLPSNKGLFHRIIAQSGAHSKTLLRRTSDVKSYAKTLARITSCSIDDEYKFVECLREIPADKLVEMTAFDSSISPTQVFFQSHNYPVVDGELFKEDPILGLEIIMGPSEVADFFGSIEVMMGFTSNEGSLLYRNARPEFQTHYGINVSHGIPHKVACEAVAGPFVDAYLNGDEDVKTQLCNLYQSRGTLEEQSLKATEMLADLMVNYPSIQMLEYHTAAGKKKSYQYQFSKRSPSPIGGTPPSWFKGCGHGDDLFWLFKADSDDLTDEERTFSKMMIQYWTSFAKKG